MKFLFVIGTIALTIVCWGAYGPVLHDGKKAMGAIRTTVIIDEKGKVEKIFSNVRAKGHAAKVLEEL